MRDKQRESVRNVGWRGGYKEREVEDSDEENR